MEARLARVEVDVDYIKRDVRDLRTDVRELREDGRSHREMTNQIRMDLAVLTERVNHLPTKGYIVVTTSTIIGVLTALMLFAVKIKAALHLVP